MTGGFSVKGNVMINMHRANLQVQFLKERGLDKFSAWLAKIQLGTQNFSRSPILRRFNAL